MPDWPGMVPVAGAAITSYDMVGRCPAGDYQWIAGGILASAVWPAANRAIFIPFILNETVTAYQMGYVVGTQSGNYDIGLYDINANLLVSLGSTAVPVAGPAVANIADTTLKPGVYYMALSIDNVVAAVLRTTTGTVGSLRVLGMHDQDLGSVTLPNPATFSALGTAYVPSLTVNFRATV